ncbi:hypothetical protein PtA15_14A457 [Puccinia triticina]|uniref:Peptidase S9A N-terminal domain-containing protein n=1 Tax=Puccinia triticina TaxID=208348 RepID=A0ABY7D4P6_9BASI|nr:uncharacterized protein PtA15_14A457 [Puccinia triticina]WAQ91573.1 hypothetical protein PtA15_14A457 [Puccinia triticina]
MPTTAIAFTVISNSGTYMAYGLSRSGSDTYTVYIRHTDCPHTKTAANGGKRGEDPGRMKDIVENVRMTGVNWMRDHSDGDPTLDKTCPTYRGSSGDPMSGGKVTDRLA